MSSSIDWASPQWTFVGNLVAMSALFLFDKLVAPPQARWFAIHSFGNLLAVLAAMNATLCTLADPVESMSNLKYNDSSFFGNATPWPILIVNAIHIYHMVAFKLSSADFFHHAVFALTMGSTGQLYRLGAFRSFLVFWLSGLPGGIDYFSLVLVKLGKLDGLTQKRNSVRPSMSGCVGLAWSCRGSSYISTIDTMGTRKALVTHPCWCPH